MDALFPEKRGSWGDVAHDNRQFINTVMWILRAGHPGEINGIWKNLLEQLIEDPDYEWLMIDASHVKSHPHGAGSQVGNQEISKTKGGSIPRYIWPWVRMVSQSDSVLQRIQLQTVNMQTV